MPRAASLLSERLMSALPHATMSAWSRDETGGYSTEMNGWSLRVRWRPESAESRRGFWWEAERPGAALTSPEIHEEIEIAMAHAEQFAGGAGHDPPGPS